MIAIVIGLIFLLFILIIALSSQPGSQTDTPAQQAAPPRNDNTLQYLTNDSREQSLSSAKITGNTVFCRGSLTGDFKIGSYELNDKGMYDVWNDDHTIKIGYVNPSAKEVFLTPGNVWSEYKQRNPYSRAVPKNFLLLAVHWRWSDTTLFDAVTGQPIARFTGNPVAAGAAFICLTYETLMYNKYYSEFHDWK